MSKLSKRVDELTIRIAEIKALCEIGITNQTHAINDNTEQIATLQKQMSCICSNFEVNYDSGFRIQDMCSWREPASYIRRCLSCGLETVYESKEAAMKDKDALLKIEIDRLTAERKGLKK